MRPAPTDETPLNTAFDVLANEGRRKLLVALLERTPQSAGGALAPTDVGHDDVDFLRIQMTHTHLPKLEDGGFVEWNRDTDTVRKGPRFDEIRPLLELMYDHSEDLPDDWL